MVVIEGFLVIILGIFIFFSIICSHHLYDVYSSKKWIWKPSIIICCFICIPTIIPIVLFIKMFDLIMYFHEKVKKLDKKFLEKRNK